MNNECPHPTCKKQKPMDHYACKDHWFSLPSKIQKKIWAGFRQGDILKEGSLWSVADKEALQYWRKK